MVSRAADRHTHARCLHRAKCVQTALLVTVPLSYTEMRWHTMVPVLIAPPLLCSMSAPSRAGWRHQGRARGPPPPQHDPHDHRIHAALSCPLIFSRTQRRVGSRLRALAPSP